MSLPLHLVFNVGTTYLAIGRDNVAKRLKEEHSGQNGPNSFTCPKSKWSFKKYTSKTDTIVSFGRQMLLDEQSKLTSRCLYYKIGVGRHLKFCPIYGQS